MTAENGSIHPETGVCELLQTLSHSLRRDVISYFENQPAETTASLEELVTYIESRESTKTRDEIRISLYQVHLPTLKSKGWLAFDPEGEIVSYHGHDEAEQVINEIHDIFKT